MGAPLAEPQTTIGTVEEVDLLPFEDDDDPDVHTHIVRPGDNTHILRGSQVTGADIVFSARLSGKHVNALCGHRFVPKRNPEKYPACEACFRLAGQIHRGERP